MKTRKTTARKVTSNYSAKDRKCSNDQMNERINEQVRAQTRNKKVANQTATKKKKRKLVKRMEGIQIHDYMTMTKQCDQQYHYYLRMTIIGRRQQQQQKEKRTVKIHIVNGIGHRNTH